MESSCLACWRTWLWFHLPPLGWLFLSQGVYWIRTICYVTATQFQKKINALFRYSFSASSLLSFPLVFPLPLWKHAHQRVLREQSRLFTMKEFNLLVIIDGKSQHWECFYLNRGALLPRLGLSWKKQSAVGITGCWAGKFRDQIRWLGKVGTMPLTSTELWFVSAEDAAPVELCWDPEKCCWVKPCLSKHGRWCLKPSNLLNIMYISPSPALCSLGPQSKWHLVLIVAFDFFVVLLKANNFHVGLMEELPSQLMNVVQPKAEEIEWNTKVITDYRSAPLTRLVILQLSVISIPPQQKLVQKLVWDGCKTIWCPVHWSMRSALASPPRWLPPALPSCSAHPSGGDLNGTDAKVWNNSSVVLTVESFILAGYGFYWKHAVLKQGLQAIVPLGLL